MNNDSKQSVAFFQIDLLKLARTCLHFWWIILISIIIVGGCAYAYAKTCITPQYTASISIYVNNINRNEEINYLSDSNLSASQKLVNTYISLVKSDYVLDVICEKLGMNPFAYSTAQLRTKISADPIEDTELFKIFVTDANPIEATRIANVIGTYAPEMIAEFIEGSSARLVDKALVPQKPSSPSCSRYALIGAVLAGVLAILCISVICLFDTRIKDETDLLTIDNLPILGRIPDFNLLIAKTGSTQAVSAPNNETGGTV